MKTAYKFRIYPNKQWESVGVLTLETCRHLWNNALADRRNTWKQEHKNTSYEDQAAILTLEKKVNPHLQGVFSQVEQDVLRRLKKAFDNFFRRVREHAKKKGYPRFKAEGRYNSFTYPQSGFKLDGTRLILSKFPCSVRVFLHRPIEGVVKTCTIKRDGTGRWYVIFTTERDTPNKVAIRMVVGVDLGISHAVATSEGQTFDYPRYYVQAEKKLRAAQKTLHRRKLGSKNRKKAAIKVAEVSRCVVNQRNEFLHKVTRELVDSADAVIFEDLSIGNMLKNHHLAKHISDVSWGKLVQFARSKAERAGKSVVLVDPRNTSQNCSGCGTHVLKVLAERTHMCPKCGLTLDRDHNAALNILALGLRVLACGELTPTLGRMFNVQANSAKQEALPL